MDLKEFSRSIVSNANEAKNHISFLIGNLNSKDVVGKAILGLYESFPDNYKDKELFTPVMLKFFGKYKVTENNIDYYNKFSSGWTSVHIESVKKVNPQWEWSKTEFKNSLEFSKSVDNSRSYQNPNQIFQYLENNSETLEKFIKKDKNKLIDNFSKQKCWYELILNDYSKFSQFCKKYDFDKIDILKNEFIESHFGIDELIFKYDKNQFFTLFKDLESNDFFKLFEKTQFLANDSKYNSEIKNRSAYTVIEVVLKFIAQTKNEEAQFLIDNFPDYIQQNFNKYCYKHIPSTNILDGLQQCVEAISEDAKKRVTNNKLSIYADCLPAKFNAFKNYLDTLKFKESLDHDMPLKFTKPLQRKI